MTANDSKSYLGYLNTLIDKYNNTYHISIGKKLICADYSALTEEIELIHEVPKFKIGDRVKITKHKNIFSKDYTRILSREIFLIDFVLETFSSTYKIKDLNGEKIK